MMMMIAAFESLEFKGSTYNLRSLHTNCIQMVQVDPRRPVQVMYARAVSWGTSSEACPHRGGRFGPWKTFARPHPSSRSGFLQMFAWTGRYVSATVYSPMKMYKLTDCDNAPLFYSLIRPHDFIIKRISQSKMYQQIYGEIFENKFGGKNRCDWARAVIILSQWPLKSDK